MKKEILITGFPETKSIAKQVASILKCKYTIVASKDFPDQEFNIHLNQNPGEKTVVLINSITGDPDEKLVETILAAGIAKDFGAKKVVLVATYMPYMRQDKHFHKYDSFSSKYIFQLFFDIDKIIAIDPHLHRIKKMSQISSKAKSITINELIAKFIRKNYKSNFDIIGPDQESAQWSAKIAKMLKKKVIILNKTRKGDKNIVQEKVKLQKGRNYIIIDDIISTGKTIEGALEMAKSQGANKLVVIGIHGLLLEDSAERITRHADLIVSNSIPGKYSKIDISPAIAKAIKNI